MASVERSRIGPAALLAVLALALQLMIPPGFMPARGSLVVCPGHASGMDVSAMAKTAPPRSAPDRHAGPSCPFAGHGMAPPLGDAPRLVSARVDNHRLAAAVSPDLAPGLGLAAPPPPPRGPPILL